MSLNGNVSGNKVIVGEVGNITAIHGKSAYEIALINGFEGTEQEWLDSLKGENYILTEADKKDIGDIVVSSGIEIGSDYTLPIGGGELGGVKNGGNVVINEDGTMNAPETEVTDEQVNTAVNTYLTEHPVDGSMSADVKNLLLVILQNASYLSDQKSNIEALAEALSAELPDADTETWDYEWDYSMGSLTDNGFSFENGYREWTNEFTDKGQLVSYIGSRNSYAIQGIYIPSNFAATTTHAIIECVIEIKEFETHTTVDQGFVITLSDGTNVAAIFADNLGFKYNGGTISPIALDTEYKVRLEFDTENGAKCSINGKEVLNTVDFISASTANLAGRRNLLKQVATGATYIKSVKYREVTE